MYVECLNGYNALPARYMTRIALLRMAYRKEGVPSARLSAQSAVATSNSSFFGKGWRKSYILTPRDGRRTEMLV